jgi:hypothetical protein
VWSNAALGNRRRGVSADNGERRRRRVEGGGRPHQVKVRFTDEELARVKARAISAGLTPASYLAEIGQAARPGVVSGVLEASANGSGGSPGGLLVEQGRTFGVLERRALAAELFSVRRLLVGVATNLNQLAKVANSTGRQEPVQVAAAAAAVSRYLSRLDAVVAALDPRAGR